MDCGCGPLPRRHPLGQYLAGRRSACHPKERGPSVCRRDSSDVGRRGEQTRIARCSTRRRAIQFVLAVFASGSLPRTSSTATRERWFFAPRPVEPKVNSTSPEDETSGSTAVRQQSPGCPGFDRPGLKLQNPGMPNIASILKEEIIRVARKEIRNELASLRKPPTDQT